MKLKLLLLAFFISGRCFAQAIEPVNPGASPEAKKLLSYLSSINRKYILSGEHGTGSRFLDSVKSITGKYPAV